MEAREKMLIYGERCLSTAELIQMVANTNPKVAEDVVSYTADNIGDFFNASVDELKNNVAGIGEAKARSIVAAIELGRRLPLLKRNSKRHLCTTNDATDYFIDEFAGELKERVVAIYLNVKGAILFKETVSIGNINSSLMDVREVFSPALKRCAAAIIVAHNHPSGDASPSEEDITTTRRLSEAGKLLGVTLLDHIIVGDGAAYSLRENNADIFIG